MPILSLSAIMPTVICRSMEATTVRLTYDALDRRLAALGRDYAAIGTAADARRVMIEAERLPGARAAALASKARALAHLGEAIGARA